MSFFGFPGNVARVSCKLDSYEKGMYFDHESSSIKDFAESWK